MQFNIKEQAKQGPIEYPTERGNQRECVLEYSCANTDNVPFSVTLQQQNPSEFARTNNIIKGGSWEPIDCWSKTRTAIIIPYKDRKQHLPVLVNNLIPFLQKQKRSFTIFVAEQVGNALFNKAIIMNAGFSEVLKSGNFDCIIFHDVDMIPINLCNLYACEENAVRHLGLSRNLRRPKYVHRTCIGGASAFTPRLFKKMNGFTNLMYGWGGEDDDAYFRYPANVGNYLNLPHNKSGETNPKVNRKVTSKDHWRYMKYDGLNNVKYKLHQLEKKTLYTLITISIPDGLTNSADVMPYFLHQRKSLKLTHGLVDTVDFIKQIFHYNV